jgi:hypothetical protein
MSGLCRGFTYVDLYTDKTLEERERSDHVIVAQNAFDKAYKGNLVRYPSK